MIEPKLGALIPDGLECERDAVHMALLPVIANEALMPGDHVGFALRGDIALVGKTRNPIGIVDPFLAVKVEAGRRFYMLIYPKTITSLHHYWDHPSLQGRS